MSIAHSAKFVKSQLLDPMHTKTMQNKDKHTRANNVGVEEDDVHQRDAVHKHSHLQHTHACVNVRLDDCLLEREEVRVQCQR
jgi:hypothetical protein